MKKWCVFLAVLMALSLTLGTVAGLAEEETVKLRWISGGATQTNSEAVMDEVNRLLKARYNLELEFEIYDFGSYNDKMNMIISSGEPYDICWTTEGWLNKYLPNISKGAFLPLDDLIDQHAPGLREVLPSFLFEQARVNGHIYAIPNYQICYNAFGFSIRKDLADKYGFDYAQVKTYEDMYPFWDAIVENEKDMYAVGTSGQNFLTTVFTNDYIGVSGLASFKKSDDAYAISRFPEVERASRETIGEWYRKGYIRDDVVTVQDDSADVTSGKYASYIEVVKPGGAVDRSTKSGGHEYVQVAIQEPFVSATASRSTMTAINSGTKHPEAAIRMIEIMNSDAEIFNMINYGVEGVNYALEDGFVDAIPDSGYFYNTAWAFGNQFNAYLKVGQVPGIWEETMAINNSAVVSPILGFSFDESDVANEAAQIAAVQNEYRFIEMGDNFEQRYGEYQDKLIRAGVERYCEEAQRQLDAWLTENGKK